MSMRLEIAQATGALSTWALRNVFHRPAANFPGKAGLYIDPHLIADLKPRLGEGSLVVVGTNGKTTVTNMLADAFEAAGKTVACNRTGANLDSGLATSLLHVKHADWGVFESDELWIAKVAPELKPDFVVLLNLFRDQLDRMGEIDHLQEAIVAALESSPKTTLIYNADDPLCQAVAERSSNAKVPFGIDEDLGLEQNTVADASMCQRCDGELAYEWRQYGQLGSYRCPTCGFHREPPAYAAHGVSLSSLETSFAIDHGESTTRMSIPFPGTYMLYNVLAVFAAADCCGLQARFVDEALHSFSPRNGRLQPYEIEDRRILLNLAKNPTGFNQNLRIITGANGPKAVAFFINDKEADGHDVSWLWDIDFQELAGADDIAVYAGGMRRNDMQVRLKYAGVEAGLVDGAEDFLAKASARMAPETSFYLIANYTALPVVKTELDAMRAFPAPIEEKPHAHRTCEPALQGEKLTIVHMYPELLNLYGDRGNVIVLADRARRRGIEVDVVPICHGQRADLPSADIVFIGGGPDREQRLASHDLIEQVQELRAYVEDDGVLLAICGGFQILGKTWLLGDESVEGLGILDIETARAPGGSHNRLVDNIVLTSPLAGTPVVGYENHAGRTYLGEGCKPFGRVIGRHGKGNNDADKADGAVYRNVVATYLHGPLLAKNPAVADWLLQRALDRRAAKTGRPASALPPLDDSVEQAANEFMCHKLGVQAHRE